MTIGPQFKSYIRFFYIEKKKEKKQHTKTRIMANEICNNRKRKVGNISRPEKEKIHK
jgi:hypothetical protein